METSAVRPRLNDTSSDSLGHTFSVVPEVIGVFGSFNIIHPHSGEPVGVYHTPTCVPAVLSHRSLSGATAISAASLAGFMAATVIPSRVRPLHRDGPSKPLHPALMGSQGVSSPFSPCLLVGLFDTVLLRDRELHQEHLLRGEN